MYKEICIYIIFFPGHKITFCLDVKMNPTKPKEDSGKACTLCTKLGLRPLTRDNILFFYAPLHSMVSYAALSVNVMNPALIVRLVEKIIIF